VEKICKDKGITYRWTDDNWLIVEEKRPATNTHPVTFEEVWFNQAHIFKLSRRFLGLWRYLATQILYHHPDHRFHDVTFADGSPIPFAMLEHVRDKLDENTVSFPWQKGDLLVLDNYLAMHGRDSFEGNRRIFTAMTAP
jgi:alpha-ketoglutarate-dependent taurine dioxygenase